MRSEAEIARDMAGGAECVRRSHGCNYPACQCVRLPVEATPCACGSPVCNECQSREDGAELQRIAREQEAHNADALLRLRALRLWHYRQLVDCRRAASKAETPYFAERCNAEAATHLGFVQSLNDFFEMGDTAEADDQREDAA